MRTKNRIDLIGFVGRDPEMRTTQDGTPVAHLSVATTDRWTDKAGSAQEHTEWHRVVFFGKAAEQVAQLVHKGSLVEVEGSLRSSSFEKDGVKRTVWEVRGFEFRLLERRPTSDDGGGPSGLDAPASEPPTADIPV
jgi:single-strand DNA-binding protein